MHPRCHHAAPDENVFVTVLWVQGQAVFIPSAGLEAGDGPGLATVGMATGETVKRTLLPR